MTFVLYALKVYSYFSRRLLTVLFPALIELWVAVVQVNHVGEEMASSE